MYGAVNPAQSQFPQFQIQSPQFNPLSAGFTGPYGTNMPPYYSTGVFGPTGAFNGGNLFTGNPFNQLASGLLGGVQNAFQQIGGGLNSSLNNQTANLVTGSSIVGPNGQVVGTIGPGGTFTSPTGQVIGTLGNGGTIIKNGQVVGSIGGGTLIAPGGNINYVTGHAIFEATHGTAPKYANLDKVNPGSVILSGVMMFEYLGWVEGASLITKALEKTIATKRVTYDFARLMEGATELKCSEFGQEIIKNM
jgi:hypothetical protein